MKGNIIKELHAMGVYRDPHTKQKLECMKLVDILQVKKFVLEEQEKGVVFKKEVAEYEFIDPSKLVKKDKSANKKRK